MNVSELITSINLKGTFPDDNFFSPAELTSILNDQMKLDMVPLMMRLNEEYFVAYKDFTVATGATYRMPKRAIGAKLRDVQLVDANGDISNLSRLFEEDRASKEYGYYIKKNVVELSDSITTGTLRLVYFAAPNKLVATTASAQITSINTATFQVVVSSAPSTFANGISVDFVQNNNPYDALQMDAVLTSLSGTTLTFTSLPDDLEVGDWVTIAGEAPVPMIPDELHPVLVQSALCVCLAAKKDSSVDREIKKLDQMKDSAINLLDPRVESDDVKIVPNGLINYFRSR